VTLTSTLEITKTVTVTAPPPPSVPKTTMETDGTYRVGTDIVVGYCWTLGGLRCGSIAVSSSRLIAPVLVIAR
jgi:hypothetical protein